MKQESRTEAQKRKRKELATKRKALVDGLIREYAPLLWSRQKGVGITQQQVDEIIDALGDELATRQLAEAIQDLRGRLRSLQRKTGGDVYLPMAAVAIKADPSPYRDNAIQSVCRLNRIHAAFWADISSLPIKPNEECRGMEGDGKHLQIIVGRILFSAVVNGGLLNKSLLWRLPGKIAEKLLGYEHLAWITFPLGGDSDEAPDSKPDKDPAVRRWIVDYVTLGLMLRLLDGCPPSQRVEIATVSGQRALATYLKHLKDKVGGDAGLSIGKMSGESSFFGAAATRLSYTLPPVLIRYLKSIRLGESMSERSWWRYHYDRALKDEVPDVSGHGIDRAWPVLKNVRKQSEVESLQGVHQQRAAGKLKRCFNPPKKGQQLPAAEGWRRVKKLLDSGRDQMSPLLYSICRWFEFLLSKDGRYNGPVRASTAATYRQRIVPPMVETNWEFDISEPNPEVWEEFYADTLMSITAPVQRLHAVTTLRLYHQYMVIAAGAPTIMIEGELEEGVRIRNSILSESDYQAVRDYLHEASGDSYFLLLLEVIVILMFRAGLRPNDIVGLQFRHISGVSLEEIGTNSCYPVIYPHSVNQHTLKTSAAVRQIPLPWLVPPDELEVVLEFFQTRLVNCKQNGKSPTTAWVFSGIRNSEDPMPRSRYFGYLSKLLRQICEDPDLVSYSLRHSFLSIWALKILSGEIDDPDHPMLRPGCLPREIIYTLAEMSAHQSPDMSLSTYIKTMDLAAFSYIQAGFLGLSDSIRSRIECVSISRLKAIRAGARAGGEPLAKSDEIDMGYKRLVAKLVDNPPPKLRRFVSEGLPEELTEPSVTDLALPESFRLCRYLAHHGEEGLLAAQRIFSLKEQEIAGIRDHGRALGGLGTSPRSGGSRSRMLREWAESKTGGEEGVADSRRNRAWISHESPGDIAPALPASHAERAEAERIYHLVIGRAAKFKWSQSVVEMKVLARLARLLVKFSITERGLRIRSRQEFEDVLQTIKWLRISSDRVRVLVESLPRDEPCTLAEWRKCLVGWSPWNRLVIDVRRKSGPRISRDYPSFGICLIQIIEEAEPESDVNDGEAKVAASVLPRAGASWRVGCYYAIIAIQARLGSNPDSTVGLTTREPDVYESRVMER